MYKKKKHLQQISTAGVGNGVVKKKDVKPIMRSFIYGEMFWAMIVECPY